MGQIDNLIAAVNKFRDDRDWRQFHNPKDLALSISLESSELLENFQWKNGENIAKYLAEGGKQEVEKEIADILAYMLMLADDLHIDLEKAVLDKLTLQAKKYPIEKARGNATKYDKLSVE